MFPQSMIAGGTFTLANSTGSVIAPVQVFCQSQQPPDFVIAKAITAWGAVSYPTGIEWWWEQSMAFGTAKGILQGSSAASPPVPAMNSFSVATNGITVFNTANPPTFPALAATAINGTTYVVSMASTANINVGDYVRITVPVGMNQLGGYVAQVTAVTTNTSITLGYIASSGVVMSNGTTANITKIIPNKYYPKEKRVVFITQAAQATIYFSEQNDFTPGERVSLRVPKQWGMTPMNNVKAVVLSVTNSATVSSIVVNWNTSGYPAFTFPTSAVAATGISPSVCIPSESDIVPNPLNTALVQQPPGTNLLDAFDDRNSNIIQFGQGLFNIASNVATAGDVWLWQAYKYDTYNGN